MSAPRRGREPAPGGSGAGAGAGAGAPAASEARHRAAAAGHRGGGRGDARSRRPPDGSASRALDWARDAATWPHADKSHFVAAGGWRWHVQWHGPAMLDALSHDALAGDAPLRGGGGHRAAPDRAGARGEGTHGAARHGAGVRSTGLQPLVLLLHGTGASAHSWRSFAPLLARAGHGVLVPDLPGHGFTRAEGRTLLTLPAMADALAALLHALRCEVRWVIGHSAGAAIAAHMALAGTIAPHALVAFNGALLPLQGPAGTLFSPMARWLALNPLVPSLFAWYAAQPSVLRRLVDGTGSSIDEAGRALYGRLVGDPAHVAGALAMMASWDLRGLQRDLPSLALPLELLVGAGDRTLPPAHAERVRALVPAARVTRLPRLGHLMHEEEPEVLWQHLLRLQPRLQRAEARVASG